MQEVQASNGIWTYASPSAASGRRRPTASRGRHALQHFRGEHRQLGPGGLVDGLAAGRDVIAFDNHQESAPPAARTPARVDQTWPSECHHISSRCTRLCRRVDLGSATRSVVFSGPGDGTCAPDTRVAQDGSREHGPQRRTRHGVLVRRRRRPAWSAPDAPRSRNRFHDVSSMPNTSSSQQAGGASTGPPPFERQEGRDGAG